MSGGAELRARPPASVRDGARGQALSAIRAASAGVIAVFLLGLPLVILLGAVRFAFSWQPIYTYAITAYHSDETTGIPAPALVAATRAIRSYFTNRQPDLDVTVTDGAGARVPLFNEREIAHMHDVKALVQRLYLVLDLAAAALLLCVLTTIWLGDGAVSRLARSALAGALLTVLVLATLGIAIAAGFDRLFLEFHMLSFSNDYWELDPARDHLVQIFPQGFWFDVTIFVALIAFVAAASVAALSGSYLLLTRPAKA